MHLHLISRADAKKRGLPKYFTGIPCKNGHINERRTNNGTCLECHRGYSMNHYENNKDRYIEYSTQWHKDNPEKMKEIFKRGYKKNIKKYKQYYKDNAERHKEVCATYRYKNRGRVNAWTRKRQASKLQRTPTWLTTADLIAIEEYYTVAAELTNQTGIQFHVDHIIPLCGKLVSGLHIPSNLQILPFYENLSKNNSYSLSSSFSSGR